MIGMLCLGTAWLPARAGVTVTQNVSAGATSWPGSPLIQTVTNPASQLFVGESFNAVGGCTNYAQTFTVPATNYTLQAISLYTGGGTGTGAGTNLTLRLFDLGSLIAPNPSPYAPGTDLFNSGNGLAITYAWQANGVVRFDFTGSDQALLQAGHLYAFELNGVLNTSPLLWQRTTADTYAGGAAYRNQTWINGMNAREFALAVYATAVISTNTGTNSAWVPTGAVYQAFAAPVNGVNADGANPAAGLTLINGVLYGTTLNGGAQGAGTAFCLTPDGTNFSAFRTFTNAPDAGSPQGELAVSGGGFWGTTASGGSRGTGTIFAGRTNGEVQVLRSFAAVDAHTATNSGGASPGALIALAGDTLYGTATAGGAAANGTIFAVTTNGSGFAPLHDFSALDIQTGTNADGAVPCGGLILVDGKLYGTAAAGGAGGAGVVFAVGTNGSGFTILHSFPPLDVLTATNGEGAMPISGLAWSQGVLYGTTFAGGAGGRGTVFAVSTNGLGFAVLHHFTAVDAIAATNADGAAPGAALLLSGEVLYGTTAAGGTGAAGAVFAVHTNGQHFVTIHSFAVRADNGTNLDGAFPVAPLLRLGDSLYGTTFSGGPGTVGTVFRLPVPTSPAVITSIARQLNGLVTLHFSGAPNSTNVIQAADSLLPPVAWRNTATNVADAGGGWQFTDVGAGEVRFYRSYVP